MAVIKSTVPSMYAQIGNTDLARLALEMLLEQRDKNSKLLALFSSITDRLRPSDGELETTELHLSQIGEELASDIGQSYRLEECMIEMQTRLHAAQSIPRVPA